MSERHLSVKELAQYIGVSTDTIRRAYRRGLIPGYRVGTALRFDPKAVRRQMQRQAETRARTRAAGALDGESRPRAARPAPVLVTRGRG
jgi:excisionase family DNA binding protein